MANDNVTKPWVIAVVGPTATGKTSLSVKLAQAYATEIISADSQLVYMGLDIGTAKPSMKERCGVKHHLIDIVQPTDEYTVMQYENAAKKELNRIMDAKKTPIVTGGTGFYLKELLQAPDGAAQVPPNKAFREALKQELDIIGEEALHARLAELDPRRAAMLYPQDTFRVIRALEIIDYTGKPVPDTTAQSETPQAERPFNVCWIGLRWSDRQAHCQFIRQRVIEMMDAGWVDEVDALVKAHGIDAYALHRSHGYPVLLDYLANRLDKAAAIDEIDTQVRQYARRQKTWFQRNSDIGWFDVDTLDSEALFQVVSHHIQAVTQASVSS